MTERRIDHLEPATIAALVDRTLDADARRAAEAHLAVCADCREIWFETSEMTETASRTSTVEGVIARPKLRRSWIYAGGGLAAAAAITLAVLSPRLFDRGDRPELRDLVEAVGTNRRTEARLTGGFQWGPVPSVTRGSEATPAASLDGILRDLESNVRSERSSPNLTSYGRGLLIAGRGDEAITYFQEALAMDPHHGNAWADLAAAYLERSRLTGDPAAAAQALSAADEAVRLAPTLVEANFNRALALTYLEKREEARAAWGRVLELEPDAEWATEVRSRLASIGR